MDAVVIGVIGLVGLFLLIFGGMRIGFALMVIAFCGGAAIVGIKGGLSNLGTFPYQYAASYTMVVIPLFVLLGEIASRSGLIEDLYSSMNKIMAGLRGSLAMATVGGCAGFAAVCGSSMATVGTLGKVALPEMRKLGYSAKLATGVIASGGSLGILIPPSIVLVLYGLMTETSIGKLFMAGIFPGLLEATLYILTIYVLTRLRPDWAPPTPKVSLGERLASIKSLWPVALLFVVVIGGIYMGVFTPTEAGAVGTLMAFLLMLGRGRATRQNIIGSLRGSVRLTGLIFVLYIGAMMLNYFMGVSKMPVTLGTSVAGLPLPPLGIIAAIIVVYLLLGCVMLPIATVMLTIPIFLPLILEMGFDPIWFGILLVRVVEMGEITPPIGMNVFIMKGVAKDVPLYDIFRGILPFLIADIICIALLIAFPQISLFLPGTI